MSDPNNLIFPPETPEHIVQAALAMKRFMESLGMPVSGETLDTPLRVAKAWANEFTSGYKYDPAKDLGVKFQTPSNDLQLQTDIQFTSMCEHHLLPFMGTVAVAYVPRNGLVVGLSKLSRVVAGVAAKPTMQERFGLELLEAFDRNLQPEGVLVVVRAQHTCMCIRGAKQAEARTVSSHLRGAFFHNTSLRAETMQLISWSAKQ